MGYFFVDESIHDRGSFVLAGVVYCQRDPAPVVAGALTTAGFVAGVDEYKSRHRMDGLSQMPLVRDRLRQLVQSNYSIGVIVAPRSDQRRFGVHVFRGLEHMIDANDLATSRHRIYLDQGLFSSIADGDAAVSATALQLHEVHLEQDSRSVYGLQVADMVAHTCSTILLEHLGVIRKTVKAGENTGYDADWDLELGFALWAGIRYAFFRSPHPGRAADSPLLDGTPGLYIAETAASTLREAALDCFSNVWVGCIH